MIAQKYIVPVALFIFLLTQFAAIGQPAGSNLDESKVPAYTLPDVLQMQDGKKVTSPDGWTRIQRPYIYHLFEDIQFGKYPQVKVPIRYRLLETGINALDGSAIRKQVRVYLHPSDSTVYMDVLIYLPANVKKPVPVFVGYNFTGNNEIQNDPAILLTKRWVPAGTRGAVANRATDSSRGGEASQWQVKEILSHGYGVVTVYYGDIEADNKDGWRTGIRSTLQDVLRVKPEDWCGMGAWAYGLSRVLDYLQEDRDVKKTKIAVIGHSRLGKAALWAAASDPRFSLVVSNESGEGGAALSKRWFGETVKIINDRFPWWFASHYKDYGDNVAALPIDGHMLLSLVAPRPLYVASAEGDSWSDPRGEFLSAKEASPVYAVFGKKGITTDSMPPVETPMGETVRYHIRSGKHDVTLYDWQQYLLFADKQWK
jgi:hypothetical protein